MPRRQSPVVGASGDSRPIGGGENIRVLYLWNSTGSGLRHEIPSLRHSDLVGGLGSMARREALRLALPWLVRSGGPKIHRISSNANLRP